MCADLRKDWSSRCAALIPKLIVRTKEPWLAPCHMRARTNEKPRSAAVNHGQRKTRADDTSQVRRAATLAAWAASWLWEHGAMVWALAMIVVLAIGLPIGAWSYTRLRPPPAPSKLGTAYDPIDRWLLRQHGLPPIDRERVRNAVFNGRHVRDPELAPAAHDLAARVLAGKFRMVRVSRALTWFDMITALGFITAGIALLIIGPGAGGRALGALCLLDSAIFSFASVIRLRQSKKLQLNVATALELNQDRN